MTIIELGELIEEYEQRITAAVEAHGYEVIINHTLLNKETGDLMTGGVCSFSDKKDIAYASVTMTTHTRLAFIDGGNDDFLDE